MSRMPRMRLKSAGVLSRMSSIRVGRGLLGKIPTRLCCRFPPAPNTRRIRELEVRARNLSRIMLSVVGISWNCALPDVSQSRQTSPHLLVPAVPHIIGGQVFSDSHWILDFESDMDMVRVALDRRHVLCLQSREDCHTWYIVQELMEHPLYSYHSTQSTVPIQTAKDHGRQHTGTSEPSLLHLQTD